MPVGRGELEVSVREVGKRGEERNSGSLISQILNRKIELFFNNRLCQLEILSFILGRADVVLITSKHGK